MQQVNKKELRDFILTFEDDTEVYNWLLYLDYNTIIYILKPIPSTKDEKSISERVLYSIPDRDPFWKAKLELDFADAEIIDNWFESYKQAYDEWLNETADIAIIIGNLEYTVTLPRDIGKFHTFNVFLANSLDLYIGTFNIYYNNELLTEDNYELYDYTSLEIELIDDDKLFMLLPILQKQISDENIIEHMHILNARYASIKKYLDSK